MRAALVVALAGCNPVFGIDETIARDAFEPPVVHCFSDDFEDGVVDPEKWTYISEALPYAIEDAGELQFPIPAGVTQIYNGLVGAPFDLTDGSISVKMTPAMITGHTEIYAILDASALAHYRVRSALNEMRFHALVNNNSAGETGTPYTSDLAYVRFRHESTPKLMHTETSPDGVTWTLRKTEPMPYRPTAAQLTLLVGGYQMPPTASVARYDHLLHEAPGCTN